MLVIFIYAFCEAYWGAIFKAFKRSKQQNATDKGRAPSYTQFSFQKHMKYYYT